MRTIMRTIILIAYLCLISFASYSVGLNQASSNVHSYNVSPSIRLACIDMIEKEPSAEVMLHIESYNIINRCRGKE